MDWPKKAAKFYAALISGPLLVSKQANLSGWTQNGDINMGGFMSNNHFRGGFERVEAWFLKGMSGARLVSSTWKKDLQQKCPDHGPLTNQYAAALQMVSMQTGLWGRYQFAFLIHGLQKLSVFGPVPHKARQYNMSCWTSFSCRTLKSSLRIL